MFKLLLSVAILFLTSACSNQPKPAALKPTIKSIAIIPATNPSSYTLENVSALQFLIPLAATANYFDSKQKAKTFNEKLLARQLFLGQSFTDAIADSLRSHGYQVQILEEVSRPVDDIDNVNYANLATNADAVLHVKLTEVGLFSPRSSTNYLPRVNAHGTLFIKGENDYLYDQDIYYGVDASKGKAWAIASDKKFAFPTFEVIVANMDEVRNAFETGVHEISKRMSEQINDLIK